MADILSAEVQKENSKAAGDMRSLDNRNNLSVEAMRDLEWRANDQRRAMNEGYKFNKGGSFAGYSQFKPGEGSSTAPAWSKFGGIPRGTGTVTANNTTLNRYSGLPISQPSMPNAGPALPTPLTSGTAGSFGLGSMFGGTGGKFFNDLSSYKYNELGSGDKSEVDRLHGVWSQLDPARAAEIAKYMKG